MKDWKDITYTLYYHTFPNGKMYFGQTCQDVEKRWGKNGCKYKTQELLYKAIQKYGWENIEHRIISTGLDKDEVDFQEMFYISSYRTNERDFGYNISSGGEGTAGIKYNLSEETKSKMKKAAKGRNKGIIRSEETRKKMSESKKGKTTWIKGKHLSDETKNKISKANKGRHHSEEAKRKMSEAQKGIKKPKLTEEQKRKLSESLKGRQSGMAGKYHSEETRKKMSEAHKCKIKYKWLTPDGCIVEMTKGAVGKWHKDWKIIENI